MIIAPSITDPIPVITCGVNLREVAEKMVIQIGQYQIPVVIVDGLEGMYLGMTS